MTEKLSYSELIACRNRIQSMTTLDAGHVPISWDIPTAEEWYVHDWWWSATIQRYARYDPWAEFEQPSGSDPHLQMRAYKVVKLTKTGAWLELPFNSKRFISLNWSRQWAAPTVQLAVKNLVAQMQCYERGASTRHAKALQHLQIAQDMAKKWTNPNA